MRAFIRVGNSPIDFLSESLVFCKKLANKQWAQKTSDSLICSFFVSNLSNSFPVAHFWWAIWANWSQALIFGEWPERFAYSHSFVMSNLSDLLTLLFKKEWMSESLVFLKNLQKYFLKTYRKLDFFQQIFSELLVFLWGKEQMSDSLKKLSNSLICSFIMSNLSDLLTVILLL